MFDATLLADAAHWTVLAMSRRKLEELQLMGTLFTGGCGGCVGLIVLISWWRLFTKAGQPGWAAIIPIYNLYVILQMINKPVWWIVLAFIPCLNVVLAVLLALEIARVFGKSTGYAIGLIFLPFIFYPMMAFDDSRYLGRPSWG